MRKRWAVWLALAILLAPPNLAALVLGALHLQRYWWKRPRVAVYGRNHWDRAIELIAIQSGDERQSFGEIAVEPNGTFWSLIRMERVEDEIRLFWREPGGPERTQRFPVERTPLRSGAFVPTCVYEITIDGSDGVRRVPCREKHWESMSEPDGGHPNSYFEQRDREARAGKPVRGN